MGHPQPLTPMAMDNTAANSIINGTEKQKIQSITYQILLGQRQNMKKNPHIMGRGKENLVNYVTKHHPTWYHRTMRPRYLKATKKDTEYSKDRQTDPENSKDWRTVTRRGCAGTVNPRITRNPENTLKGTRNPITRKPDNLLKGIRDLVPNRTRSQ